MGVALMTRRDPYRRAMRRAGREMAEPRRRLPDPHHRNRRTGRRNRGRNDRPVGIPAPVGVPAVPDHQRGIRHGRIHPSPSCPVVDHHGVHHGLRHGAPGHSAQAAMGTARRAGSPPDYWPGYGPPAESTGGRTGLCDHRHRGNRRMAYRRYRARPAHAATADDRGNRHGDPGHSVVGRTAGAAPASGSSGPYPRGRRRGGQRSGCRAHEYPSAAGDAWGWTARVILRKGSTTEDAIAKIPAIESGLGVRRGSVRVIPDAARADRFTLRVIEKDPHAAPIPWPGTSITLRYQAGRDRPVRRRPAGTGPAPAPATS